MTMFNNWLAAFEKRTPSPLYGKPLMYLIGASNARAIPGSIVEPPYGQEVPGDDKIAYCDLFDQGNTGKLGPYLSDNEGQVDPAGPGWGINLTDQFTRVVAQGYKFAELDKSDAYSVGVVQEAVTRAHSFDLGIIAKNPAFAKSPLQIIAHPNVFGVIVERGAGTPATYDALRKQARKDGLIPVWFVFAGCEGSQACADEIKAGGFKGMGVTYSTGHYTDSHTVMLPVCDA